MPSSTPFQINEIMGLVMAVNPQSVLDVGCGFGKYGVLCREYLELWDGRNEYAKEKWQRRIDGIEIHWPYVTRLHDYIYDHVYCNDAVDCLHRIPDCYNLVLLIDVLEHFKRDVGEELIDLCLRRHLNILIATPKQAKEQGAVFGNPHEQHLSQWHAPDFEQHDGYICAVNVQSHIYLIGEDARRLVKERERVVTTK